jgi:hypothetical protein
MGICADGFHGENKPIARNAEFLGPVFQLPFLVGVNTGAIRLTTQLEIIRHKDLQNESTILNRLQFYPDCVLFMFFLIKYAMLAETSGCLAMHRTPE